MTEVYLQLARRLNKLPAGFPPTESGIELKILERLFSTEEAAVAIGLNMMPEPVSVIADRMGKNEAELAPLLEAMSRKGLIYRSGKGGAFTYMAAQFVVGIWEYHLNSLDKDLIRDVNEYLPHFMHNSWANHKTKQLRVIPISKEITAEMATMPYEVAEEIILSQSKIVVSDCICRKEHKMMDKGCDYPMEVCLAFGNGAYFYEENGLGRSIDKKEALKILEKGRESGLVLQPGNSQKPMNICMCCGCCCQVLSNLKTLDKPALAVHTNYFATVDKDACVACEACVERCHMDAIRVDDFAEVNLDRCIGCGVCAPGCPTGAIALAKKIQAEQYEPPQNVMETYVAMAKERGII